MKYCVTYKFIDFDAESHEEWFPTWLECCKFMKGLLDDGYQILGVAG